MLDFHVIQTKRETWNETSDRDAKRFVSSTVDDQKVTRPPLASSPLILGMGREKNENE